jgi:hypothetical protein
MPDLIELLDEFNDVAPSLELRQRILTDAASTKSGDEGQRFGQRIGRRSARWLLAAGGITIVVVLLALAAHSRSQTPANDGASRPTGVVPGVRGKSVVAAIAALQRAGYGVSVPHGFRFGSLNAWPTAGREVPTAGSTLPIGATVTLTEIRYGCCIGSPVAGDKPRSPGLVANTAGEAIQRLTQLHLPWEMRVRPFFHEHRPLLATARVVSQTPAPGVLLTQGAGFHVPTLVVAYQGKLPAAALTVPQGWQTGSSSDAGTPGGQTFTRAGTSDFRDAPFSSPPTKTLDAMRPTDLLIELFLSRPRGSGDVQNTPVLPIKLNPNAPSEDYPGSSGTRWFQHFFGNVSQGRTLDVWVFAGQTTPTRGHVEELQRVLDTIKLPPWPNQ